MSALNTLRKWNVSSVERWPYRPLIVKETASTLFKMKDCYGDEVQYHITIQFPHDGTNGEANLDTLQPGTRLNAYIVFKDRKNMRGVCCLGILPHFERAAEEEENLDDSVGQNGNPRLDKYCLLGGDSVRFSSIPFQPTEGQAPSKGSYAKIPNGVNVDHLRVIGETGEWFLNLQLHPTKASVVNMYS